MLLGKNKIRPPGIRAGVLTFFKAIVYASWAKCQHGTFYHKNILGNTM